MVNYDRFIDVSKRLQAQVERLKTQSAIAANIRYSLRLYREQSDDLFRLISNNCRLNCSADWQRRVEDLTQKALTGNVDVGGRLTILNLFAINIFVTYQ